MRLALLLFAVATAHAQTGTSVALAPMLSVPVGSMAGAYGPGVGGRLAIERPGRRVGWRLAGSVAWFAGRDRPVLGRPYDDGVSGGVVVGPVVRLGGPVRLSAGAGAFRERAGGRAPYAVVPAVEAGLGVSVPVGAASVEAEVRALAVLSDLLAGGEYTPSLRVPVSLGVRF